MTYSEDFFDYLESGSCASARVVLGELWHILQPTSVIDVGCGLAQWLKTASELGAQSIIGIDGDYVRVDRLWIDPGAFRPCDLETESCRSVLFEGARFDLVISLEVAEHLSERRACSFISELCSLGEMVLFSAAIPGQGGTHHVNEQWPCYWNALFQEHEFSCFDILRPKVWENTDLEWWYAQNVLLFAREGTKSHELLSGVHQAVSVPMSLVHPRMHLHVLRGRDRKARTLEKEVNRLRIAQAKCEDEIVALRAELQKLRKAHAAVVSSRSWKLTAPLRTIIKKLR